VKSQLPRIAVLTALALLVVAAEKFSFGVVWDPIFLSIFVAGLISVWVAGLRMRRKIRSVLGRKATEADLASILTDRHTQKWPEFNWHDFIITPKPETGKPSIKIALLLFPAEARDHLMRVLMPEQRSCGMGSVTLFGKR
jgi:hypothetical protein